MPMPTVTHDPTTAAPRAGAVGYLAIVLALAACALAAVAAVNWWVDPFGGFRGEASRYWQHQTMRHTRSWRGEAVRRAEPATVLLGSSRTEVGFDPQRLPERMQPAINVGLSSATSYELLRAIETLERVDAVRTVVLMAGPEVLVAEPRGAEDFAWSRFDDDRVAFERRLERLLSLRTLKASAGTVKAASQNRLAIVHDDGFRDWAERPDELCVRERFARVLARPDLEGAVGPEWTEGRSRHVQEIARLCAARGWRMVYVIPPVHAVRLEKWAARDKLWRFDWLRREAVRSLPPIFESVGRPDDLSVIDFSGCNAFTVEPIPDRMGAAATTRWWWEELHFTAELGAIMLDRIAAAAGHGDTHAGLHAEARPEASTEPAHRFGVRLTKANVEAHIGRQAEALKEWREAQAATVEWARRLFEGS